MFNLYGVKRGCEFALFLLLKDVLLQEIFCFETLKFAKVFSKVQYVFCCSYSLVM